MTIRSANPAVLPTPRAHLTVPLADKPVAIDFKLVNGTADHASAVPATVVVVDQGGAAVGGSIQ